jgi:porin
MGSFLLPDKRWNIRAAIYDASNPTQWNEYSSGLDFKFNPANGMLFTGQIDYHHPSAEGAGRKGSRLSLGMFADSGKRPLLSNDTLSQAGNTNFWLTAQHDLGEIVNTGDQLTGFLTVTGAPQTNLNLFPFSIASGFSWSGIFSKRPSDAVAFGASYYMFSSRKAGQNYEIALELAYTLKLTPWMTIQPDLQGVIRPSGTGDIPSALVMGFSTEIVF